VHALELLVVEMRDERERLPARVLETAQDPYEPGRAATAV
jgi:hypothetical protein